VLLPNEDDFLTTAFDEDSHGSSKGLKTEGRAGLRDVAVRKDTTGL
jgi:hypothetical protein